MNRKAGAALILALGFLALIAVMAVTFATMMRFEEKTGRNSLYQIQARQIAGAAFQYAIGVLKKDLSDDQSGSTSPPSMYDAADEGWITGFAGTAVDLDNNGSAESKWIYVHQNANGTGPVIARFAILIQDEAGKMNLNTAGPGLQGTNTNQSEGWSPYELDLQELPGIGATTAANIFSYRKGINVVPGADVSQTNMGDDNKNNTPLERDGIDNDADATIDETNEGLDSPTEFDPEIPYQDDHPITSLEELTKVSGIGSSTLNNLKAHTTVSSYDSNQYWSGSSWVRKTTLNHLLSTGQLYNLINASSAAERYRVSANMIDGSDRDPYPTWTTSNAASPNSTNSYMGVEGLQMNEVLTRITPFPRLESQSTVSEAPWTDPGSFDQGNNNNQAGQWRWNWDNGTYEIQIIQSNGSNITIESVAISDPSSFTAVTIADKTIDLSITDPQDFDAFSNPIYATFTQINIRAGKFVEIINLSQRNIDFSVSSTNSWKLVLGGNLAFPSNDGLPATSSGGTALSLSSAWNIPASFSLAGHTLGTTTYNYLVMADSLYALDAKYGDSSGRWGDSATEGGTLFATSSLYNVLNDSGTNLALTDYNNYLICFSPTVTQWNVDGYGGSSSVDQSRYRFSPIRQVIVSSPNWLDSTTTPTPGRNNQTYSFTGDPHVKDRPFATLGELGDVFLGTGDSNPTYDVETYGGTYFDKMTLAAKRLEAEDADSLNSWSLDPASGVDGTSRYIVPNNSSSWTWNWSFDILNSGHITKPFRFRNSQVFDTLAYGQFSYNFQSPSGTTRYVRPNGSTALNSTTASGNSISIAITGPGGSNPNPKLDHIVLFPDPYTWGKININTATSNVLQSLKGITSTLASNIISYRASNPFNQIQEIFSVSDIDEDNGIFKPISNLITVRSDVYRVMVRAERIVDVDGDGVEGESSDLYPASIDFDVIVDRNPSLRFPGTSDRYRMEEQKYKYQ